MNTQEEQFNINGLKFTQVNSASKYDHFYFGRGKILLTGEYFIMDGAKGLALPTVVGQTMGVRYSQSFNPVLHWKSYDVTGKLWFESKFEFWHFNCLDENPVPEAVILQKILKEARKQNKHFLRDELDVFVETQVGFPLDWGLGSSSSLVYNVAQWAYVSPFELLFHTFGGSGYDIACAQSDGPILYQKKSNGPHWSISHFEPEYKNQLYLVYLGNKQDSRDAISYYKKKKPFSSDVIQSISKITDSILASKTLEEFEQLVNDHENIVAQNLDMKPVKEIRFSDYWGSVKSLGAWGGDFVLATSSKGIEETKKYFLSKGHDIVFGYSELINTRILNGFEDGFLH